MIFHLATKRGIKAVTKHLSYRPALNMRVEAVPYESLLRKTEWPRGVYLFTDFERMTPPQRGFASWLHDQMSRSPGAFLPLNHPTRHVSRFDLLRRFHTEGLNDFNVYRACDLDQASYPIFLRYEDRHIGSLTPLLKSQAEAEDRITSLAAQGEDLDRMIAVEFVDTSDSTGLFRKYGAFRIAGRVVPRHMFASDHWEVKIDTNNKSPFRRREEYAYLRNNPHEHAVMDAFEAAGLTYGRIDYAMKDGRLQVWEINDNPQMTSSLVRYWRGRLGRCLLSLRNLDAAFAAAEATIEPGPAVRWDARELPVWEALCAQ